MANSLANIPALDAVHPGAIENAASGISKAGIRIQHVGGHVVSAWGKLHGIYKAPESGELIGAMNPVQDHTYRFGWEVGQVGAALSDYAAEIAPVKAKLAALKTAAGVMLMAQATTDGGEDHWRRKQSNVDAENKLLHDVAAAVNEGQQIAAKCANRINGLTGGTQFHGGAVATGNPDAYWSTDPSHLSWADPVKKDDPWWKDGLNGAVGFGKGVVVDGAWGMVKGIGSMAGFGPKGWDWHNMWNSYKGIEIAGLGLAVPGALGVSSVRKADLGLGKDFVAWDEWKKDKGRAAGKVGFNIITLGIPPTRLGLAGRTGDAALAISRGLNKVDVVGHGVSLGLRVGSKGLSAGVNAVKNLHVGEGLTHMKGIHLNGLDRISDAPAPRVDPVHVDPKDSYVTVPVISHHPMHVIPHGSPTVAQVAEHVKSKIPHDAGHSGAPKHPSTPLGGEHPSPIVDPVVGSHAPPVIGGHPTAPVYVPLPVPHDPLTLPHDPGTGALPHGPHVSPVTSLHPHAGAHSPLSMPHDLPMVPHSPLSMPHDLPMVPHDPPTVSHSPLSMPHDLPMVPHDPPTVPHDPPMVPHDPPMVPHDPPTVSHDPPTVSHDPAASAHVPTIEDQMRHAHAKIAEGARLFHDDIDAAKYAADNWNDYTERLSQPQKDAFYWWTHHRYLKINDHFRYGYTASPEDVRTIEQIDKAMQGNPVPDDVVVSRATNLDHISMPVPAMEGNVFHERGYMSTSLGSIADEFKHKEAFLHLRVPKGTQGIWVEKIGACRGVERELLLGRGLRYHVDEVILDGEGKWHIYGRILPK